MCHCALQYGEGTIASDIGAGRDVAGIGVKEGRVKVCIGCGRLMTHLEATKGQLQGDCWTCDHDDCPVVIQEYRKTDGELDYIGLRKNHRWSKAQQGTMMVVGETGEGQ